MNFLRNTLESGEFYHLDPRNGHIWFCSITMQGFIQGRKRRKFAKENPSSHLTFCARWSLTWVKEPEEVVSAHCAASDHSKKCDAKSENFSTYVSK